MKGLERWRLGDGRPRHVYLAVVFVFLVCLTPRLIAEPAFHSRSSFVLFVPALIVGAALGGARPALLATVLGLLAEFVFSGWPLFRDLANLTTAVMFVLLGVAAGAAGERLRRDRVEKARAYDELAAREAHLKSIFDAAPDGMVVIDSAGEIRSFSATAERMFGWAAEDVLGRNVSLLVPAPHGELHDAYLRRGLQNPQGNVLGSTRLLNGQRKDGSLFPIELTIAETRSGDERYFTGFIHDLSERRAAERRLRDLQAELVHVSRLTAMGEMASAIAHELNQPLTAVSSYVNASRRLLAQRADRRLVQEALADAGDQALRAGEIIRRLRLFIAKGEVERRPEPLDELLDEAVALAMVGANDQGVSLLIETDPLLGPVLVDKIQVQQVVFNLLRNGLEAMRERPRREIRLRARAAGEFAEVAVSDSGPGVEPTSARQLFEPFVTSKRRGLGVGLSICRRIVEGHGGRLWLDENGPSGATFKFTIPLAPAETGVACA